MFCHLVIATTPQTDQCIELWGALSFWVIRQMFLGRFFGTSLHKVLIGQSTISTTTEQYYSVYFKHSGRNILENIGKTFHTEMVMSDEKK